VPEHIPAFSRKNMLKRS